MNYNYSKLNLFNELEGYTLGNIFKDEYIGYKNYTPMVPEVLNDKDRLIQVIKVNWNYLHDLNLYLDTHPNNIEALRLFKEYRNKYNQAVCEYEKRYGVLDLFTGDTGVNTWKWLDD